MPTTPTDPLSISNASGKHVDVLVIDDDRISRKVIRKALDEAGLGVREAVDGESGLREAAATVPDIVLLDVEMPGLNGYEVCDKLRHASNTEDVPIIFLSAHSSLRERMLGYESGADDYLVKPFESQHLVARINVLLRYREQRGQLRADYEIAHKAAMSAMIGTSELSQAMQFMERSFSYNEVHELGTGMLEALSRLSLSCTLLMTIDDQSYWYATDGNIKPLEAELIRMSDSNKRFLDFGSNTLVNFSDLRLLVHNMPLDDMERYGRIKDLLPVLLSAAHARLNALRTQLALYAQSTDLVGSFKTMRRSLYDLVQTLVHNRESSRTLASQTVIAINDDLLRMGLEERQEAYLLNRIESTFNDVMQQMDAGPQIHAALTVVLNNMRNVMAKQESMTAAFSSRAEVTAAVPQDFSDDVELF